MSAPMVGDRVRLLEDQEVRGEFFPGRYVPADALGTVTAVGSDLVVVYWDDRLLTIWVNPAKLEVVR